MAAALAALPWATAALGGGTVAERCAAGADLELCAAAGGVAGVSLLQREAAGSARARRAGDALRPAAVAVVTRRCSAEDFKAKELDIVLYGATGFTGSMSAAYLAKDHRDKPRWAIGGRHREDLEKLQAELSKLGSNPPEIIVATLDDPDSVRAMVARAKVVMTYAGPYRKFGGDKLIEAAIESCTHYVDLCGETEFKVDMLERCGDLAKSSGVVIMQSVGMDSMPADVLAIASAELLAGDSHGPPTDVVVTWSKFNTFISGGTLASAQDAAGARAEIRPYSLAPEAPLAARVDTSISGPAVGYDAKTGSINLPYPMNFVDAPTVRRSLAVTFPGAPIHYSEIMSRESLKEMKNFLFSSPDAVKDPVNFKPAPGEGPPKWLLETGGLGGQGTAVRGAPHESQARVHLNCLGDPSYNLTSMWSVDVSLSLAVNGSLGGASGYLTPALALGPQRIMERMSLMGLCSFWTGDSEVPPQDKPSA